MPTLYDDIVYKYRKLEAPIASSRPTLKSSKPRVFPLDLLLSCKMTYKFGKNSNYSWLFQIAVRARKEWRVRHMEKQQPKERPFEMSVSETRYFHKIFYSFTYLVTKTLPLATFSSFNLLSFSIVIDWRDTRSSIMLSVDIQLIAIFTSFQKNTA